MPPENFKMKKFENFEVLSYNIYIKVERKSILYGSVVQMVRMKFSFGVHFYRLGVHFVHL